MRSYCLRCRTWDFVSPLSDSIGDCPECGMPLSIEFSTPTRCREADVLLGELRESLSDEITDTDEFAEAEIELEKLLKEDWEQTKERLRRNVRE